MKYSNQSGAIAAIVTIISCFLTWISIPDLGITVSGFESAGTSFGKPGLMNTAMSCIAFCMFLIPRIWAKRVNLFFTGFNMAWAVRNYILVTACHGGDCPVKHTGIYLLMIFSFLQLLMAVIPDVKLKN
ncbi:hypothetical protein [Flavihumibacter solisilvae]|uniref:hypothetical protein n=1 Tax=Flavihumibacter solisilvae TaxID=1349421 RepID=UPI0009E3BE18|nr:hypothetical protein [Flavihumibacter solisilvae]